MGEAKTYTGGCHCGKVRYEVTAEITHAMTCNCSICSKKGTALTFVPKGQFKLLAGENALTDYQFNKMNIHHLFCATCGVGSFARGKGPDGSEMVAINTRCLDGLDLDSIKLDRFDGKSV
jgi:hypothetical protein